MVCPPVRGDNARALASRLAPIRRTINFSEWIFSRTGGPGALASEISSYRQTNDGILLYNTFISVCLAQYGFISC